MPETRLPTVVLFRLADWMSDTRSRIIRAVVALVAERGTEALTTKLVASRAGVSESTLFREFKTKKEFLDKTFDYCWGWLNSWLALQWFVPESLPGDARSVVQRDFLLVSRLFEGDTEAFEGDPETRDIVNLAFVFSRRGSVDDLSPSAQQRLFEARLLRHCELIMKEQQGLEKKYASAEVLADDLLLFLITAWQSWWMWRDTGRVPTEQDFMDSIEQKLSVDGGGAFGGPQPSGPGTGRKEPSRSA